MFNKPFRVKSNSQLKGSERKKFRAELLKNFSSLTEEKALDLAPNKEVIIAVKILTYSGESAMVYCVQKLPVVFEIDKVMFPTVYMLWKVPDLLYTFTTWPQVLPKITGGADLMLPGVVLKDGFYPGAFGRLLKGERAAVNLTTNSAVIAVGRTALSSSDMFDSAKRGKAVNILHYVGDELWGYGTKMNTPDLGPPVGFSSIILDEEEEEISTESSLSVQMDVVGDHSKIMLAEATLPDTDGLNCNESEHIKSECFEENRTSEGDEQKQLDEPAPGDEQKRLDEPAPGDEQKRLNEPAPGDEQKQLDEPAPGTVSEMGERELMDDLLEYCFLKALHSTAKKAEYPMLSSKFFKLHILRACPPGKSLDIKKTNFRKLSVFLNKMNATGVVVVRELTKGVDSIMQVNSSHELLRNFIDKYEDDSSTCAGPQQMTILDSNCRPEITEMYVVTAAVLPIFCMFGLKKGASLPVSTARNHITNYVKQEGLQDPVKKRFVKLNDILSRVVESKPEVACVSWEDLFTKVLGRMTRSYQMSFSGQNPVLNKGKLEPIDIQVGKRTGNKKVTLVNNLELYGINLTEFARECQHGVAASTSISSVPGKKSAQLMVQGNQVLFVGNLLTAKYEIPKRYIRGLEFALKPKK